VLEQMRQELAQALTAADLLATPTSPSAAFGLGEKTEDPLAMYLSDIFTTPASLVGLPAVSVPAGSDDRGLPLGLQLTGRAFAEVTVLAAARAFESLVGWVVAPGLREATV
jgi:aspartyl-tRNA(Asn)/glutamyl-tRNA(Gln) amidotransferase subunit A